MWRGGGFFGRRLVIVKEDGVGRGCGLQRLRLASPGKYKQKKPDLQTTLYPVLRRLQKDECLEVYDKQFDGRNRRYYKVTEKGMAQLNLYRVEWRNYSLKINELFEGGVTA